MITGIKVFSYLSNPPKILLPVILVLLAFALEPSSFAMTWNQGRAAILAVIPLSILEMGRTALSRETWTQARYGYMVLIASSIYYVIWSLSGVKDLVIQSAIGLGVPSDIASFSTVQAFDYAVTTFILGILILAVLRSNTVTPILYLGGMATFLLADSALPYDSLGILQFIVPSILVFVASIVNSTGVGGAFAQNNFLTLTRGGELMSLAVFWPSAGVHSMMITLLATIGLSAKLRTTRRRASVYFFLGVLGSFAVNIIRISLLALYALGNISDPEAFERFHSVAGELLFLPWIAGYLFWLVRRETRFKHADELR